VPERLSFQSSELGPPPPHPKLSGAPLLGPRGDSNSLAGEGCTVIRFLRVSSKFGTCTVVRVYGTLVEDKMCRFKGERAHFSFSKCPIYTHDGASANFSTNSHETDNSVGGPSFDEATDTLVLCKLQSLYG
jgi:hypothetical protein